MVRSRVRVRPRVRVRVRAYRKLGEPEPDTSAQTSHGGKFVVNMVQCHLCQLWVHCTVTVLVSLTVI